MKLYLFFPPLTRMVQLIRSPGPELCKTIVICFSSKYAILTYHGAQANGRFRIKRLEQFYIVLTLIAVLCRTHALLLFTSAIYKGVTFKLEQTRKAILSLSLKITRENSVYSMNYFVNFHSHLVFLILKLGVLEVFSMIATQTMKKKLSLSCEQ